MNQLFFLIATVFLVVSVVRFIYAPETSNTQAGLATAFFLRRHSADGLVQIGRQPMTEALVFVAAFGLLKTAVLLVGCVGA